MAVSEITYNIFIAVVMIVSVFWIIFPLINYKLSKKRRPIKVKIPEGYFEAEENWKNSVHLMEFESADFWYDKLHQLLPDGPKGFPEEEESYYYYVAINNLNKEEGLDKASKICFRAVEKGLKSDRMLALKAEIELKLGILGKD